VPSFDKLVHNATVWVSHKPWPRAALQRIVADLISAGYLDRKRIGRRNRYTVQAGLPLSLPAQRDVDLNSLLNLLLPGGSSVERKQAITSAA
jgi:hypothetical protein